ncbi:hypothetical protein [uncultured Gammaproteobacteria bacterium]|nr:hypothetical protein [uncultured Gammaproteobacteria bacterium]CAC9651700.1 hypothetical protein [uncultured Gammaproteobacteria bacterium]
MVLVWFGVVFKGRLITLMLWSLGLISQPHFYMSAYLE